jgi:hypothetical protein
MFAMDLTVLMDPLDLPRLASVLDGLGHAGRVANIREWDRELMSKLYEAAKGFKPVTLDDYVPPTTAPLTEVIHHGKNSLPAFTHFQKRFCKPQEGGPEGTLYGFNFNTGFHSHFIGPGYYVAHKSPGDGEVDIDYTALPNAKPEPWPEIKPNVGIGGLVYGGMIDVMRGISTHVSIGRAKKAKSGAWMDAWFVLCREDLS